MQDLNPCALSGKRSHVFQALKSNFSAGVMYSPSLLAQQAARMFGGGILVDGSWLDKDRALSLNANIRSAVQDQIQRQQRCEPHNKEAFTATSERNYQLVLMQLVLNYFNSNQDETSHAALAHHAGLWGVILRSTPELRTFVTKQLVERRRPASNLVVVLPEDEMRTVYSLLVQLHHVFHPDIFNNLMECIGAMMKDESPQIRTRAVKALTKVVDADTSVLMSNHRCKVFIKRGVLDRSPSVREATLDLMGRHMQETPELIEEYYDSIHDRIQDIATSVRKRVVRKRGKGKGEREKGRGEREKKRFFLPPWFPFHIL